MPSDRSIQIDQSRPVTTRTSNRTRLLDAALIAMHRDGIGVAMGTVAADAGLGVGTLYRHFATRDALLEELAFRSILEIAQTALRAESAGGTGWQCIDRFIGDVIGIRDQIMLPLTGGPVFRTDRTLQSRAEVRRTLQRVIDRGHDDRSVRPDATPEDVIMFSAALCQPGQTMPVWDTTVQRLRQIFVDGLSAPSR